MNHRIQMWELLPALLWLETQETTAQGKAHPGSYCLTDIGRPTQTPQSSPVSQGTNTGWQLHQRRLTLSASNRGWGGGLEFIWPTFKQPKIRVPPLRSLHCQWRNACVRQSWRGALASSFQVPVGVSLSLCMDVLISKHLKNTDILGT